MGTEGKSTPVRTYRTYVRSETRFYKLGNSLPRLPVSHPKSPNPVPGNTTFEPFAKCEKFAFPPVMSRKVNSRKKKRVNPHLLFFVNFEIFKPTLFFLERTGLVGEEKKAELYPAVILIKNFLAPPSIGEKSKIRKVKKKGQRVLVGLLNFHSN